jgi:hypothetical protein
MSSKLALPDPIDTALSQMSEAFCHLLFSSPQVFPVPLVHIVTPVAAIRTLLPYLPTVTVPTVYAHLWQVNAAIVAGFIPEAPSAPELPVLDAEPPLPAALADRAAEHGDPHAIKFTEAALREHTIRPSRVYLDAAHALLGRLPPA